MKLIYQLYSVASRSLTAFVLIAIFLSSCADPRLPTISKHPNIKTRTSATLKTYSTPIVTDLLVAGQKIKVIDVDGHPVNSDEVYLSPGTHNIGIQSRVRLGILLSIALGANSSQTETATFKFSAFRSGREYFIVGRRTGASQYLDLVDVTPGREASIAQSIRLR